MTTIIQTTKKPCQEPLYLITSDVKVEAFQFFERQFQDPSDSPSLFANVLENDLYGDISLIAENSNVCTTFLADLTFYGEAEGRSIATPYGKFNCIAKVGERMLDCRLIYSNKQRLVPGNTYSNILIKFLDKEHASKLLKLGVSFILWEGRDIGVGKISIVY